MDRQKAGGQSVMLNMVMGDLLAAAYQDGKAGRSADILQQLCDEWDRRHADDPVALKAGILCRSELMRAYRLGAADIGQCGAQAGMKRPPRQDGTKGGRSGADGQARSTPQFTR